MSGRKKRNPAQINDKLEKNILGEAGKEHIMKKTLALCLAAACFLLLCGCGSESKSENLKSAPPQEPWREPPAVAWSYGRACALRDRAMEAYRQVEVDGSGMIKSTDGSSIIGHYDENNQLQIMEITVYGETGRWIERFYPFDDAIAVACENIKYFVTFGEILERGLGLTKEDEYLDAAHRMVVKDGQVYHYTGDYKPMVLSDDAYYAELYAKAAAALGDAAQG